MFYIYDKDTSAIVITQRYRPWRRIESYKTEGAAKAALTRMQKAWLESTPKNGLGPVDFQNDPKVRYAISDATTYYASIEKQVEVVNMMSGKTYFESINTPRHCSPSSEAYWSM